MQAGSNAGGEERAQENPTTSLIFPRVNSRLLLLRHVGQADCGGTFRKMPHSLLWKWAAIVMHRQAWSWLSLPEKSFSKMLLP